MPDNFRKADCAPSAAITNWQRTVVPLRNSSSQYGFFLSSYKPKTVSGHNQLTLDACNKRCRNAATTRLFSTIWPSAGCCNSAASKQTCAVPSASHTCIRSNGDKRCSRIKSQTPNCSKNCCEAALSATTRGSKKLSRMNG